MSPEPRKRQPFAGLLVMIGGPLWMGVSGLCGSGSSGPIGANPDTVFLAAIVLIPCIGFILVGLRLIRGRWF